MAQANTRRESDTSGKAGGLKMWAAQSGCGYLFASDTIRKGDDYRTPVIPAVPAVFLSRDQEPESSGFSEVITHDPVSSNSQGKQPDGLGMLQDSGFRLKNTAGMTTPANVKLWESTGRAGGLP